MAKTDFSSRPSPRASGAVRPLCLLLALLVCGGLSAAPARRGSRPPQARTNAPRVSIPSRPAGPHDRFLAVKGWTGNVTWHYAYTATDQQEGVTLTKTKRETVGATCFLQRRPAPPQAVAAGYSQSGIWAGRVVVNGSYYEEDVLVAGTVTSRTVKQGSGTSTLKDEEILTIDIEHGTYTLGVPAAEVNLQHTITETHSGTKTDNYKWTTSPFSAERDFKLPGSGLALDGSSSVPVPMEYPILSPSTTQGRLTWSFSPTGKDGDPEAKLFLTDHNQLPEEGKPFAARVTWTNAKPQMVRVLLSGVSREKGVCLNDSPSPDPPSPEDMDLKPSAAGNFVAMPSGTEAWTGLAVRPSGNTLNLRIECRDYGAFGKLSAEILVNGRWYRAKPQGIAGSDVPVPWDENGNKVADAWEQGIQHGAVWDEETDPPGNGVTGDGFSHYEEYRGVMARGTHKRLDPQKWDLVVENRIGAPARAGIDLFADRSGINVVELKQGELHSSRLANPNHGWGHAQDQYGVLLVNDPVVGGSGETRPAHILGKTPKLADMCVADLAGIASHVAASAAASQAQPQPGATPVHDCRTHVAASLGNYQPLTVPYQVTVTVAHELAHACHVAHHGKNENPPVPVRITKNSPGYCEDGSAYPIPPGATFYELPTPIGVFGKEGSGAVECIMTYNDDHAGWVHHTSGKYFRVPPVGELPMATLVLCQSKTGTGINAPNNHPVSFLGDAEVGNCKAQLRVKD